MKSSPFQRAAQVTFVRWDKKKAPPVGPVQMPDMIEETAKRPKQPGQ